ncbi:MAG: CinA family nicotinamide mononucleotide deamidase-related protein [Candidatus Neomarinimicrobiota bacterium]
MEILKQKTALIINIGDELLAGHTLNTNACWMSSELRKIGVYVTKHLVIADEEEAIVSVLDQLDNSVNYIFITGGLGPTDDDKTKAIITEYFGGELVFSEEVFADLILFFKKRSKIPSESNREQAFIPNNAERIMNYKGTASGMIFSKDNKKYYVMPGIPYEMKSMMKESILPALAKNASPTEFCYEVNVFGLPESYIADQIKKNFPKELTQVKIAYYPSLEGITIRLNSCVEENTKDLQLKISHLLGKAVFSHSGESLESIFVNLCIAKKLTVSCAESCTGGRMADMITSVPGSSQILNESYITYSNEAKQRLLGVPESILQAYGAVSEETVTAMLKGLFNKTNADLCIAASGIAGPGGGTVDKPVGLVYIGVKYYHKIIIQKIVYDRGRKNNKEYAARAALNIARLLISE